MKIRLNKRTTIFLLLFHFQSLILKATICQGNIKCVGTKSTPRCLIYFPTSLVMKRYYVSVIIHLYIWFFFNNFLVETSGIRYFATYEYTRLRPVVSLLYNLRWNIRYLRIELILHRVFINVHLIQNRTATAVALTSHINRTRLLVQAACKSI